MSKKDVYKTVKKQSQSLLIEKKSNLLQMIKPVDNEDDALAFLRNAFKVFGLQRIMFTHM